MPSQRKRSSTLVACNECARRRVKCDGARPVCGQCDGRGTACEWVADAGEPRTAALKRKYSTLLQESADEHEMLDMLRSATGEHASRLLQHLRSGESIRSTLSIGTALSAAATIRRDNNDSERHTLQSPAGMLDLRANKTRPARRLSSSYQSRSSHQTSSIPKSAHNDSPKTPGTTLKVLPSLKSLGLPGRGSPSSAASTSLRKSPSAPELFKDYNQMPDASRRKLSNSPLNVLDSVHAVDCNVTYADDGLFRDIIRSYLTWDHPYQRFFDEELFLRGLAQTSSELSSDLLTNAVVMFGARNYYAAHPKSDGIVENSAYLETRRLWEQDCTTEGSLASAVAGLILFQYHAVGGTDKLAVPYILRTQHIIKRLGLYRDDISHRVYDHEQPLRTRLRSVTAWGLYAYFGYCEIAQRQGYGLPSPPPVPLDRTKSGLDGAKWTANPLDRRQFPALIDEIFTTRCQLYLVINEILTLQSRFDEDRSSNAYMEEAYELYVKLSDCWDLRNVDFDVNKWSTPQLILLHCTYHHSVLELLRPCIPQDCGLDPRLCGPDIGKLRLSTVQICSNAAFELRRLLRHHEALFEGYPVDVHFAAAITAVAFDSISFSTTHGGKFAGEQYSGFLAAIKIMKRMERAFHVLHFALQGIKHALGVHHLSVPAEVAGILTDSEDRVEGNAAMAKEQPKANWVFDVHRKDTDVNSARLESVIREMNALDLAPG